MKFEEKQKHAWWCDVSRGDVQCPYVIPNFSGDGYLCCTWREGHPEDLPHEILADQIYYPRPDLWILKPPKPKT
jgi:hypothetical protein